MQRGLRKWPERTEESRSSGASEGVGEREEPTELVCWEDGSRAKAGAGRAGWGGWGCEMEPLAVIQGRGDEGGLGQGGGLGVEGRRKSRVRPREDCLAVGWYLKR